MKQTLGFPVFPGVVGLVFPSVRYSFSHQIVEHQFAKTTYLFKARVVNIGLVLRYSRIDD